MQSVPSVMGPLCFSSVSRSTSPILRRRTSSIARAGPHVKASFPYPTVSTSSTCRISGSRCAATGEGQTHVHAAGVEFHRGVNELLHSAVCSPLSVVYPVDRRLNCRNWKKHAIVPTLSPTWRCIVLALRWFFSAPHSVAQATAASLPVHAKADERAGVRPTGDD